MDESLYMRRITAIDDSFHMFCMDADELALIFFVKDANTVDHIIDVVKQP